MTLKAAIEKFSVNEKWLKEKQACSLNIRADFSGTDCYELTKLKF